MKLKQALHNHASNSPDDEIRRVEWILDQICNRLGESVSWERGDLVDGPLERVWQYASKVAKMYQPSAAKSE